MSVASKLTELQTDISNAYDSVETMGGTIPTNKNTNNLADAIESIPSGGGSVALPDGIKFGSYTSEATNMSWLANMDTSALTDARYMFYNYTAVTSIPVFDTSNVTSFYNCFAGCTGLIEAPALDTSSATVTQGMYSGCSNLTTIPVYNLSKVMYNNGTSMFSSTVRSLTNASLDNLLQTCITGTGFNSSAKTLKRIFGNADMSAYYPAATIQALPHYQDFINAGWTIGWS